MNYENAMKAFLFILGALFITFIFVEDARLLKRIEALEDNNICFIQIKEDRKEKSVCIKIIELLMQQGVIIKQ